MKVVEFVLPNNDKIIELFEDLRKLVEAGAVENLAFIAIEKDLTINTGWSGSRAAALLGGVARLSHLINLHMDRG